MQDSIEIVNSSDLGYKLIPLTQGRVAIVDDADFENLNQFQWHWISGGYAVRKVRSANTATGRTSQFMHRFIFGFKSGMEVDHINGDKLDNRRVNLRFATPSQNQCNKRKPRNNTSGFKGVSWNKKCNKWQAKVTLLGKIYFIGLFEDAVTAYSEYCSFAKRLHGEFTRTD